MSVELPDYTAQLNALTERPPVEVLREVAEALPDKTGGLVHASVFTVNPGGGTLFRHTFYLRVPRLNDYSDPLFYVWHDADLYPVNVLPAGADPNTEGTRYNTEADLAQGLEMLFARLETVQRITALMSAAGR